MGAFLEQKKKWQIFSFLTGKWFSDNVAIVAVKA
jgi:hypothetical protein